MASRGRARARRATSSSQVSGNRIGLELGEQLGDRRLRPCVGNIGSSRRDRCRRALARPHRPRPLAAAAAIAIVPPQEWPERTTGSFTSSASTSSQSSPARWSDLVGIGLELGRPRRSRGHRGRMSCTHLDEAAARQRPGTFRCRRDRGSARTRTGGAFDVPLTRTQYRRPSDVNGADGHAGSGSRGRFVRRHGRRFGLRHRLGTGPRIGLRLRIGERLRRPGAPSPSACDPPSGDRRAGRPRAGVPRPAPRSSPRRSPSTCGTGRSRERSPAAKPETFSTGVAIAVETARTAVSALSAIDTALSVTVSSLSSS